MKLRGKEFTLLLERDGEMIPVCCGRDLSIEINSDILEATKHPASKWRSFYYGNKSWNIQSSGLVELGNSYGFKDVFNAMKNDEIIQFVALSWENDELFFSGNILAQSITIAGGYRDMVNQSFQATGDGELNIISPYNIEVLTDEFGNPIIDEHGNIIYSQQTSGSLPPIDLTINC